MKIIGINIALVVQKKSTPLRKPRNNGGSPSGVSEPPIFATKNIKNTTICTLCFLSLLALRRGLIRSIAAPVVPIQLASIVPTKIIAVFMIGVPTNDPVN